MENVLSPEFLPFVDQQVASGRYRSRGDVVTAGLRILEEREKQREWLRKEIQIGIDQLDRGEGIAIETDEDEEAFFSALERRINERSKATP